MGDKFREGRFEKILDRIARRLALPPAKRAAIIRDEKFEADSTTHAVFSLAGS
jgi:hypothetical protein